MENEDKKVTPDKLDRGVYIDTEKSNKRMAKVFKDEEKQTKDAE